MYDECLKMSWEKNIWHMQRANNNEISSNTKSIFITKLNCSYSDKGHHFDHEVCKMNIFFSANDIFISVVYTYGTVLHNWRHFSWSIHIHCIMYNPATVLPYIRPKKKNLLLAERIGIFLFLLYAIYLFSRGVYR